MVQFFFCLSYPQQHPTPNPPSKKKKKKNQLFNRTSKQNWRKMEKIITRSCGTAAFKCSTLLIGVSQALAKSSLQGELQLLIWSLWGQFRTRDQTLTSGELSRASSLYLMVKKGTVALQCNMAHKKSIKTIWGAQITLMTETLSKPWSLGNVMRSANRDWIPEGEQSPCPPRWPQVAFLVPPQSKVKN